MKQVADFDAFLTGTVDLNATRLQSLDDSVAAIETFLEDSDWEPNIRDFHPQGSWAHKTIIKPMAEAPFDADLLVLIDPVSGWEPRDYVNSLHGVFKASGTYADKVERSSHCVTIVYAGEKRIDIVPCIRNRGNIERWEVCNRSANEFERSEPIAYNSWITGRNTAAGGNRLRKVTRLIKYLRAFKTTFTAPSFVISTLLGLHVWDGDATSGAAPDVPTALRVLVGRLDDYLQLNAAKPEIHNPTLWDEKISDHWTDDQYGNFRAVWHRYRGWIDDAFQEADKDESTKKWQRVFGEDFAPGTITEQASKVGVKLLSVLKMRGVVTAASDQTDPVELVRKLGKRAIPPEFKHQPWMKPWSGAREVQTGIQLRVRATLHRQKNGPIVREVADYDILPPDYYIHFRVVTGVGLPPPGSNIQWRITNTGPVAASRNQLRGGFERSEPDGSRWEHLEFHGVHMAEAFMTRPFTGRLMAQSDPFYVIIE